MDYTVDAFDTFRNKAALETFFDVIKTFVPLHVVARLILYTDLEDTHEPIQKLCVISDSCLDDFNTGYLNSKRGAFWRGSSPGNNGYTYVNGDGRILPDYTLPPSEFWQVSSASLWRNTSRRRNYRYALGCYPYTRPGTAMPIALNHYGIATSAATLNEYTNTWEYIIKGFEYDTQSYLPISSTVWDNSGYFSGDDGDCLTTSSLSSGDYALSTLYPVRAVSDDVMNCSSVVIHRDTMKGILEVMTERSISTEGSDVEFSDLKYRSFEFGTGVHENFDKYRLEFSASLTGGLKNTLSPVVPYYGGFNFISYAYGPTIWNSDCRYRGEITTNVGGEGPALPGGAGAIAYGYERQWSSVVGGTESGGIQYYNFDDAQQTISNRPYFAFAPNAATPYDPSGVYRSTSALITNEIVSGIQIWQPYEDSQSFVVINDPLRTVNRSANLSYGMTLFNVDGKPLQMVVPFNPSLSSGGGTFGNKALNTYNMLRPQSQFKMDVAAVTQRHKVSQVIGVELITSGVLDDDGKPKEWTFCWRDKKWIPSDTPNMHVFVKNIDVASTNKCTSSFSVDFHTQDILTVKSTPCGSTFKSTDVHTESTGYLLKVYNNTTVLKKGLKVQDGVVINEISILDKVLNTKMNNFNSLECDVIFSFWDTLADGAYSRYQVYSEGTFEINGGSRAEYVEVLGGTDYSTSSFVTVGATDYSYKAFEVED